MPAVKKNLQKKIPGRKSELIVKHGKKKKIPKKIFLKFF